MIYDVIAESYLPDLIEEVNKRLSSEEGWELQGGVSVACIEGRDDWFERFLYCQAMVRIPPKSPAEKVLTETLFLRGPEFNALSSLNVKGN